MYKIKKFVRENNFMLNILSVVYRFLNGTKRQGKVQVVWTGSFLKKVKIKANGKNSKVFIAPGCRLQNFEILCFGNNNNIYIDEDCTGSNVVLWCSEGGNIRIGKKVHFTGGIQLVANEGKEIIIGNNCLFADNITFRTGDSHAIYNAEGLRINYAQDIHIADHVWFASGATILKGTEIGEDSVVGTKTLVSGKHYGERSLIVGNPGRVVKENIHWEHDILNEN